MDWQDEIIANDKTELAPIFKKMKTRLYQTNYTFECENSEIIASGEAHISFLMDEENDPYNIDLEVSNLDIWNVAKEEQVITIRAWMIRDIKELIESEAIDYAIQHETF